MNVLHPLALDPAQHDRQIALLDSLFYSEALDVPEENIRTEVLGKRLLGGIVNEKRYSAWS